MTFQTCQIKCKYNEISNTINNVLTLLVFITLWTKWNANQNPLHKYLMFANTQGFYIFNQYDSQTKIIII